MSDYNEQRRPLPGREVIAEMTDIRDVEDLLDDVERRMAKIETDLEFSDRDDDWAARARSALSIHRYTHVVLTKRLDQLSSLKGAQRSKPPQCSALSEELLHRKPIAIESLSTADEAEAACAHLMKLIDALRADRETEAQLGSPMQDQTWLRRTKVRLAAANAERTLIEQQARKLRREGGAAARQERRDTRMELFYQAARDFLGPDAILDIWAIVDKRYAELQAA